MPITPPRTRAEREYRTQVVDDALVRGLQAQARVTSLSRVHTPEQASTIKKRAIDLSVPFEYASVMGDTAVEEIRARAVADSVKAAPSLAKPLSDPYLSTIADGDEKEMVRTARAAQARPDKRTYPVIDGFKHLFGLDGSASVRVRTPAEQAAFEAEQAKLGKTFVQGAREIGVGLTSNIADLYAKAFEAIGIDPTAAQSIGMLTRLRATEEIKKGDALMPAEGGPIKKGVFSGVRSLPGSLAGLGVAAVAGPLAGAGFIGANTQGRSYVEGRNQGLDVGAATAYAATDTAIEIATEYVPFARLLNDTPVGSTLGKRLLRNLVDEQIGEQAATALQDLNAWAVLPENADKTFNDYLADRPDAAIQTAIATLVSSGATNTVVAAIDKVAKKVAKARTGEEDAVTLDTIMDSATKHKMRERDPEAFAEYVDSQTQGTGAENVYLPVEALDTLFQSENVDEDVQAFFEQYQDQIEEARVTGGDVVIPTSAIAARLAGTPAWEALKPDARLDAGGFSPRELETEVKDAEKILEQRGEEIANAALDEITANAPAVAVFEDVKAQLVAAGFTDATATKQASVYAANREAWGKRLGMTALEYHQQNPVSFERAGITPDAPDATRVMDQDSDAFKKWFGNSKAVDETGKPKVWYHGSGDAFGKFAGGRATGVAGFFTTDPSFAEEFAVDNAERLDSANGYDTAHYGPMESFGPTIYPVYLSVKNPFDFRNPEHLALLGEDDQERLAEGDYEALQDQAEKIKALGFDGYYEIEAEQLNLAVFDPSQIKSASGNNGAFDPNNPDIRFQASRYDERFGGNPVTVADRFGNPASLMEHDDWAMLTAENPRGEQADELTNARAMRDLEADLQAMGLVYTRAIGKYGQVENSFAVVGITQVEAEMLGRKYDQDSVLTRAGLTYQDGSVNPSTGEVEVFTDRPEDFFTEIPELGVQFAVGIDFDNKINPDTGIAGWTPQRVDKLIESADQSSDKRYVVMMSPDEFLGLTLSEKGREVVSDIVDGFGPLDTDQLEAGGPQTLVLNIGGEPSDYQKKTSGMTRLPSYTMGHDGRHRATLLKKAGVTKMPVVLNIRQGELPQGEPVLIGGNRTREALSQGDTPYTLVAPVQITAENRDAINAMWTPATILFQSATIRRGKETLEKYGLDPNKRHNTRAVAAALEARQRAKYGYIDKTDRSPAAVKKIANWMAEEVEFEMENPGASGVGWYSTKFQNALDIFAGRFPELATDRTARNTMTALIAITSDGQKVLPNFRQAADIYSRFRETGKFTGGRSTQRQASVDVNMANMQQLYDTMGADAAAAYLLQEEPVSKLKKIAAEQGVQFSSAYPASTKLPLAAVVFGPKLGAFYANLMGADGYLTMDRWWSRTFNRYRGSLLQAPTRQGLDRFKQLLGDPTLSDDEALAATVEPVKAYAKRGYKNGSELEKAANTLYKAAFENIEDQPFNGSDRAFMLEAVAAAKKLLKRRGNDISVADIQAVLWYYEKRLYGELGARQTADISYEEAARDIVAGGTGGRAASSAVVDPGTETFGGDPTDADIETAYETLFQKTGKPRGQIAMYTDRMVITLFEDADLSTLLHETGHLFVEELARNAVKPNAPADVKADWAAMKLWLKQNGHTVRGTNIPREAHELMARGFERYLMEGRAPSKNLEGVFGTFRAWLVRIYQNIQRLATPITPEVREVFDRLLATQEAIDAYREEQNARPLFADKPADMTQAEFDAYRESVLASRDEAQARLTKKIMEDIRKRENKRYKDRAKYVRDDVIEELNTDPRFVALHLLRTGRWLGDGEREQFPVKIDRDWFVSTYGATALDRLPKGPFLVKKDGDEADFIAEMVGFPSGAAMVDALFEMGDAQVEMRAEGDRRSLIDKETDERVKAILEADGTADAMTAGSIEEEAQAAVENEQQGALLSTELRYLSRGTNQTPTPYRMARVWAERKIRAGTVQAVASRAAVQQYARAAAKSGRLAEEALIAGDQQEAYRQKQAQLINHALFMEAKLAADKVDTIVARMRRLGKRAAMKSVDQDYMDRVHGLLEGFDFRKKSRKFLEEQQGFAEWAAAQSALGFEVQVPPRLMLNGTPYARASVEELYGLDDAVKALLHLGKLKQGILDGQAEREFNSLIDEMVGKINDLPDRKLSTDINEEDRPAASVLSFLIKIETIADDLDGGDPNGPFNRLLTQRANEMENVRSALRNRTLDPISQAYLNMPAAQRKRLEEKITIPQFRHKGGELDPRNGGPTTMTRMELLSVALNTGNLSNLEKMATGEGWSIPDIRTVLDKELAKEDWDFVQSIWDSLASLWPDIAATERALSGVVPEQVEITPVATKFGPYRGGYYPVVYDPARSQRAENNALNEANDLFGMKSGINTPKGHTITRTEATGPILRSVEAVLFTHIEKVITRIAYAEYARDVLRTMNNPRVRNAIDLKLGREYRKQIRPWLQRVVNAASIDQRGLNWAERFLRSARVNMSLVAMGFRASTAIAQIGGLTQASGRIGPRYVALGMKTLLRDRGKAVQFVFDRSPEMERRNGEVNRDVADAMKMMRGKNGIVNKARVMAFWHIGMMDRYAVAVPTWLGAHAKAIDDGMTDREASFYADKMVRTSQGNGAEKDLANWQSPNSEAMRALTLFYTIFNVQLNAQWESVRAVKKGNYMKAAVLTGWFLMAAPLVDALLSNDIPDPDDDDDTWANWFFRNVFFNLFSGIPLVRDVSGYAERKMAGQYATAGTSPVLRAEDAAIKAGGLAVKAAKGEELPDNTVKIMIETPGYFLGLPTGQPAATGQFLWDYTNGDTNPEGFTDWYFGLVKGKVPEEK